jgi:predicted dinucleotide-binding enzyme
MGARTMSDTDKAIDRVRVLLVGAGSVGQVYGRHFQRGGAEVRYLVRPKYVAACAEGFVLHQFAGGSREQIRFQPDRVSGSAADAARGGVDVVVLCMSIAGLKGPWLDELLAHIGDASVLSLVPGLAARDWLLDRVPEERLLTGIITLLAYPGPMAGQAFESGTAYWFPPLSPSPIEGSADRVRPVVDCLKHGGQPATVGAGVPAKSAVGTSMFMPLIASLELANWSFAGLKDPARLEGACTGAREAMAVVSSRLEIAPPMARHMMRPFIIRTVLWFAPRVVPFDIEQFLAVHFSKVSAQTRIFLDDWIGQGAELGVEVPTLSHLAAALGDRDATTSEQ